MTTSKILKVVNRQLIRRRLPHGLISWRYLLPGQPEYVKIHRQLWLMGRHPSLPLPLYLLLELLLWLRWVCWYCWKQSWELVRHHGAKIKGDTGIAPRVLLWRLLSPGIGHCMPPHEVYCFGLYLPDKAATAWQYVFIQETSTFHSMRSTGLPDTATSQRVIQDKFELAKVLGKHGIPMVPTVALIPRATQFDPSSLIKLSPRLFCKPRHGSAARNNFIIEQTDDMNSPAITAVNNCKRTSISPEDALREAMQHDDFLVQPLLTNHPELAPLSFNGDAITVRIVTENPVSPQSNYAVLEIPA
ncbi:MAG: hypothetical protein FIA91_03115, partial [Geobacter sp.]|nr:hypothetical protein [Geobacter sp.]